MPRYSVLERPHRTIILYERSLFHRGWRYDRATDHGWYEDPLPFFNIVSIFLTVSFAPRNLVLGCSWHMAWRSLVVNINVLPGFTLRLRFMSNASRPLGPGWQWLCDHAFERDDAS